MPGTMTFWGYKDTKDTVQLKDTSHHASHNSRAGMKGAGGTSNLGHSIFCPKSRKLEQGKMGPEELGQPHPAATQRTITVMGKQLKKQVVPLCTYLTQTSPDAPPDLVYLF